MFGSYSEIAEIYQAGWALHVITKAGLHLYTTLAKVEEV